MCYRFPNMDPLRHPGNLGNINGFACVNAGTVSVFFIAITALRAGTVLSVDG